MITERLCCGGQEAVTFDQQSLLLFFCQVHTRKVAHANSRTPYTPRETGSYSAIGATVAGERRTLGVSTQNALVIVRTEFATCRRANVNLYFLGQAWPC